MPIFCGAGGRKEGSGRAESAAIGHADRGITRHFRWEECCGTTAIRHYLLYYVYKHESTMIQKPFANINHFSLAHGTARTSVGSFFPRPPLRFEGVISPSSSPPPLTPPLASTPLPPPLPPRLSSSSSSSSSPPSLTPPLRFLPAPVPAVAAAPAPVPVVPDVPVAPVFPVGIPPPSPPAGPPREGRVGDDVDDVAGLSGRGRFPGDKKGEDDDEEGGGGRGGRGTSSVLTASSFDGAPPTRLRCTLPPRPRRA